VEEVEMRHTDFKTSDTIYKGHIIRPLPEKLRDTNEWTIKVQIARSAGPDESVNRYLANYTFPTHEEARDMSIDFARRIIDGRISGIDPP
jgi:hypothetical protein